MPSPYTLNVKAYRVISGDRAFTPSRIVAWQDGTIRVYTLEGKQVSVAVEGNGTWARLPKDEKGRPRFLLTVDGVEWQAIYTNCACSSPLKRWPYTGLPS